MDEPRDPFREETGGPWHYSLRKGETMFQAVAELPDITKAIIAVKGMSRDELECMVLERLYMWHAMKGGPPVFRPVRWLYPDDS